MEIRLSKVAIEDIQYLHKTNNTKLLKKIEHLLNAIIKSPFVGLGKPEPLKNRFSGKWSRRIDKEHRLIYEIFDDYIKVHSFLGHYS